MNDEHTCATCTYWLPSNIGNCRRGPPGAAADASVFPFIGGGDPGCGEHHLRAKAREDELIQRTFAAHRALADVCKHGTAGVCMTCITELLRDGVTR